MKKAMITVFLLIDFTLAAVILTGGEAPAKGGGGLVSVDPIAGNMRYVPPTGPAGFVQGDAADPCRQPDERPFTHILSRNLAVMETEVTQAMWAALRAADPAGFPIEDPSHHAGSPLPVERVNLYEAVLFANRLSVLNNLEQCYWTDSTRQTPIDSQHYMWYSGYCDFTANGYRLPTEGEWEYFCRAGTTGPFSVEVPGYIEGNCYWGPYPELDAVAWWSDNAGQKSQPVGTRQANPWNLKDVHGNVHEWCWDWYFEYPQAATSDYSGPPTHPDDYFERVIRGGDYWDPASDCRSADRSYSRESDRFATVGFRLVRTLTAAPNPVPLEIPVPVSPADGASVSGTAATLQWQDTNANPGEAGYRVRIQPVGGNYSYYGTSPNATAYTVTGLTPGTSYHWNVQAMGNGYDTGDSDWAGGGTDRSFTMVACVVPSGMANNTAADENPCADTGACLGWTDPSEWGDLGTGTRTFDVLRDGTAIATELPASIHAYTDMAGDNGVSYQYQVQARNGCGESVTTAGIAAADNVAIALTCAGSPSPADGATSVSPAVTLGWGAVSGASSYDVYLGTSSPPGLVGSTGSTAYQPAALAPGTTYYWKIVPRDACGSASGCAVWSFTSLLTSLGAPTHLVARAVSGSQVDLGWKDNATTETGFKIERKDGASGTYAQVATVGASTAAWPGQVAWSNQGLAPGTAYTYRVRATNAAGDSGWSNEASVTTVGLPLAPSNLTTNVVSSSAIQLGWQNNAPDATGFRLERKQGPAGTYAQIAMLAAGVTSFQDSGLASSALYGYRVRATNPAGDSAWSPEQLVLLTAGACSAAVPVVAQAGVAVPFQAVASGKAVGVKADSKETLFSEDYEAGSLVASDDIVGNMRFVPTTGPGGFTQGSPARVACAYDDEAQFTHILSRDVAVMETEVTRQMWLTLRQAQPTLPADPSGTAYSPTTACPVQKNTCYEAILFANLLSVQNGFSCCYYADADYTVPITSANYTAGAISWNPDAEGYRLPTEGEWEYFARAGTATPFSIAEPAYGISTCGACTAGTLPALGTAAWFCANASGTAHPVGAKAANPWNLRDVHGNVFELCWDLYGAYPAGPVTDYGGVDLGRSWIARGGSFNETANWCRSAFRAVSQQGSRYETCGFRLVRTLPVRAEWDWDFGDGSAHSTEQNPAHTYTNCGTYNWILSATIGTQACQQQGTIRVYSTTGNFTVSGFLGVGLEDPQRAIHIRGGNAVFRMDRDRDSAAFLLVRTDTAWNPLKSFVVGVDAAGSNDGQFILNDLGTAVSGAGARRLTIDRFGTATFGHTVTASGFVQTSARRYKEHLSPLAGAMDQLLRLQGVRFDWRGDGRPGIGLLAEEATRIVPELASRHQSAGLVEGFDYRRLTALLVEGIKGQQWRIARLQRELMELRTMLEELKQTR